MPELPEVETVRRGLNQLTLKQKITGGDVLLNRTIAYPFSAEDFLNGLKKREIISWHRRGKYLIAELSTLQKDKETRGQGDEVENNSTPSTPRHSTPSTPSPPLPLSPSPPPSAFICE